MTKQSSIQYTERQIEQLTELEQSGYGNWTQIIRLALESYYNGQRFTRTGERLTIRLSDPLPCAILSSGGICGKPAYVATADQVEIAGQWTTPGQWLLQPVCEDCARQMAEMYE